MTANDGSTAESCILLNTYNPFKSWWTANMKYVVLGVIIVAFLFLCIHIKRTMSSFHHQLQNLTGIVAEQQQRLNIHSKILEMTRVGGSARETSPPTVDALIHSTNPSALSDVFYIANDDDDDDNNRPDKATLQGSPREDPPVLDIENEIAEEMKELEESAASSSPLVVDNEGHDHDDMDRVLEETLNDAGL